MAHVHIFDTTFVFITYHRCNPPSWSHSKSIPENIVLKMPFRAQVWSCLPPESGFWPGSELEYSYWRRLQLRVYTPWKFCLYTTVHLLLDEFRFSLKSSLSTQSVGYVTHYVLESESDFGLGVESRFFRARFRISESWVIYFQTPQSEESHKNMDSSSPIPGIVFTHWIIQTTYKKKY